MRTSLIPIGNSRGVRIPKPLIDQCGLVNEIEMDIRDGSIVIHAPRSPRAGWGKSFKRMARLGDDALLDTQVTPSRWDSEEWQWK